jgi:hypothetical protein
MPYTNLNSIKTSKINLKWKDANLDKIVIDSTGTSADPLKKHRRLKLRIKLLIIAQSGRDQY